MNLTHCPACLSKRFFPVRRLRGQRSRNLFPVYFCLRCRSLFNPSGYKEDEGQLRKDLQWHIEHFDTNTLYAKNLVSELSARHPNARTFLDIGSGIGTMLLKAQEKGIKAEGVEPNRYAVEYGNDRFGIQMVCDFFRPNLFDKKFDLIICTHVLEHLEEPRRLIQNAISLLAPSGLLFISLPFRRRALGTLKYLLLPNHPASPFYHDNDVHIVHFSHMSFSILARDFDATGCEYNSLVNGYVFSFT